MSMKSVLLFITTAALVAALGACSHTTKKTADSGAASAGAQKAASADSDLDEAQKEAKRQSLLKMADETLKVRIVRIGDRPRFSVCINGSAGFSRRGPSS
jgi:hypothetical protein